MAKRSLKASDIDVSQVKKSTPEERAASKPQTTRTRVKDQETGKTTYQYSKTPEKAAADTAAGRNVNIGKVVTGPRGAKFDFTEVKQVGPEEKASYQKSREEFAARAAAAKARKGTQAGHSVTDSANYTRTVK